MVTSRTTAPTMTPDTAAPVVGKTTSMLFFRHLERMMINIRVAPSAGAVCRMLATWIQATMGARTGSMVNRPRVP